MSSPAKPAAPAAKPAKLPKEQSIRLVGEAGAELRIVARANKDGQFVVSAFHAIRNPEGKKVGGSGKGASSVHKTAEEAKKAMDDAAAKAVAVGWTRRAGGPGNVADAFSLSNLPAPKAAPAK